MAQQRYLFKYFYIGLKMYFGSQRQKDQPTIEETIINALLDKKYMNNIEESKIEFASRTDRGVSARGAAFSMITEREPILMEINSALPREIGIWAVAQVPDDFISRFAPIQRHYKYVYPFALLKDDEPPNLELTKRACKALEGTHDFMNFSKRDDQEKKTIRDMDLVDYSIKNNFIVFDFKSKAFLRQQIRRMVKKILEVGREEISLDDFLELFNCSKSVSYQPAEPDGLILWDIVFDNSIQFIIDEKSTERMQSFFSKRLISNGVKFQMYKELLES